MRPKSIADFFPFAQTQKQTKMFTFVSVPIYLLQLYYNTNKRFNFPVVAELMESRKAFHINVCLCVCAKGINETPAV